MKKIISLIIAVLMIMGTMACVSAADANVSETSTHSKAYTSAIGYWGECGGSADESFVFKFFNGDTYMGYTSLKNIDGILDGDVYVTWNMLLDAESNTDECWDMKWDIQPSLSMQPTRVEHWVDGEKAAECALELNWADSLSPVVAAVTDNDGKILNYVNNRAPENANDKKCLMLADAIAAGGNITMLRNVTIDTKLTVPADTTLNLDLNGYEINGLEKSNIALATYGDVTVKDSSIAQTGAIKAGVGTSGNTINVCAGSFTLEGGNIYSKNNALLIDEQAAEITIKGGTITAEPTTTHSAAMYISSTSNTVVNVFDGEIVGYNGILLWNNTTVNIEGGSIEAKGSVAIQGNGNHDNTEINISDGKISGYYAAIYHPQAGELNISGGELTGWTGVVVKGGNVNISNGSITATGEANTYQPVSSGFIDTGDALYVEHYDNSTNSENYGTPTVTVTGGTFTSANGQAVASYANSGNAANGVAALDNFISGGTFSSDVSELLADGAEIAANGDGTFGVVSSTTEPTWYKDTDAGYYTADGADLGMMRFLFSVDVAADQIKTAGIKYINAAAIDEKVVSKDGSVAGNAFYGDVYGIALGTAGNYLAKAYIITNDDVTYWSDELICTPNFTQYFTDYVPVQ